MAALRFSQMALCVLIVAIAAGSTAAEESLNMRQRPTLEEWKEGQANETAQATAVVARNKKTAAINKVMQLLASLKVQVLREGEAEASTYDKYACFCKDTTKTKTEEISQGEDGKATLDAEIARLESVRVGLDTRIKGLLADIAQAQVDVKIATATRQQEMKVYDSNSADLKAALEALDGALKSLKASKAPTFLQLNTATEALRKAAILADALGVSGSSSLPPAVAALLQQAPDVAMENYKFHSDAIIKTLEKLLGDFSAEKVEVDKAEVSAAADHDIFLQDKADFIERKTKEVDAARSEKARTQEDIATASQERSSIAATLLSDKEYLMELATNCHNKAKTWDQRSGVRQNELSTLAMVIGILKGQVDPKVTASTIRFAQQGVSVRLAQAVASSEDAMEALEASAEQAEESGSSGPAFLQRSLRGGARGALTVAVTPRSQVQPVVQEEDGRKAVAELLRRKGGDLKSALLTSLASRVLEDPFGKIKQLIQELIERLMAEAGHEANHKGWCDTAQSDARQKRDYAAAEVRQLNGRMAQLEALIDKLEEELAVLAREIAEIRANRESAVKLRAEEKAENTQTITEAKAGLAALDMAIDIFTKFYKTVAKETVEVTSNVTSLAQQAPTGEFAIGEAYTGRQGEASGIVGMLQVMKSDFERTVSETQEAEAQAQKDHLEFMTESGKALAQKTTSEDERTKQKDAAEDKYSTADDSLQSQTTILETAIQELLQLKPVCIDTGMSYADRVARREDEIQALTKGLCILGAYEKYGPGGAADC